jgi:hypothetical protein
LAVCLVEPFRWYRINRSSEQLNGYSQVLHQHHRLESLAGFVRDAYVRESVE